jgi:hypothetical protein
MIEKRIQEKYEYTGFGFPLVVHDVKMVKFMDKWVPKINTDKLRSAVVITLLKNPETIRSHHVNFIAYSVVKMFCGI